MIVREILPEEKKQFDAVAVHPLQSWEWGEFRETTGKKVIRLGVLDEGRLKTSYQLTVHPIPSTSFNLLYFPRGPMPDELMLNALKKIGPQHQAILIKLEPNVANLAGQKIETSRFEAIRDFLKKSGCHPGRPLFTKYTFYLDLKKSDEDLLAAMKPKTRYNLRLAQSQGVQIVEDNSPEAFEIYLRLMTETTKRQKFYAHTLSYHRKMWQILNPAGMAHLLLAKFKGQVLAAWVLFVFNDFLYYPYGASSREYREVMPSYAMMWAAIKFGQKMGCQTFDLWGTPGPNPDPKDPWYGFYRFKEGFGPQLVEFIGTWDLVVDHRLYSLYNLADNLRWKFLRFRSHLPF